MATAAQTAASTSFKQTVRSLITSNLSQYFSSTLNQESDMTNIMMALVYTESSFNPNAIGPAVSTTTSSSGKDYWNSSPISVLRSGNNPQQLANANQGLSAMGLTQVMGWNFVRGASKSAGKQAIESSSNAAASQLLLNAGDSITSAILGEANVTKQLLAGMIVLETKYLKVKGSGNYFTIGNLSFSSKISAAVAGYLGLGASDSLGTTPQAYAASIVRGQNYQLANNGSTGYSAANNGTQSSGGPAITVASGNTQVPPGC